MRLSTLRLLRGVRRCGTALEIASRPSVSPSPRFPVSLSPCLPVLVACLVLSAGCQQQMAQQPSYRPLEPSQFFADGMASRPIPAGTVARGSLQAQVAAGDREWPDLGAAAGATVGLGITGVLTAPFAVEAVLRQKALAGYAVDFPFPLSAEVLHRGQERFNIYCAVCHGVTGQGDGKIVQRGFTRPPSLITDLSRGLKFRGFQVPLREAPAGYYYEVISKGMGAMPDYASQVRQRDRWAIIAYIRALQLSQHARLADLPEEVRRAAESALEEPHERDRERRR
jgi:mono/diheme cytochrome c family protein